MSGPLASVGNSLALAAGAVLLALPLAALSGWCCMGAGHVPGAARAVLRFLASLPIALVGLVVFAAAPEGSAGTAVLLALAIGAYAPLALAVEAARADLGRRPERDALALGLSPWAVFAGVVVPVLRAPLIAALLRTLGRLVGETGIFLLIGIAPGALPDTLGASVFRRAAQGGLAPFELAMLVLLPLALAMLAERVERGARP